MKILAIETSCDETGITLLEAKNTQKKELEFKIIANTLSSQVKIHAPFGGVFPSLAKREHIKNLPILFQKVLTKAKIKESEIDLITVTYGPGLEPALWTGISFAKDLAFKHKIPIVPANHMEGHIFSVFAKDKGSFTIPKIDLPVLALLISGGHTELILIKENFKYKIIGETKDDAVGEAYDKVARMLNMPYPGGPHIDKYAKEGEKIKNRNEKIKLPRPMIHSKDFNFSFSGLKTAVLYLIKKLGDLDEELKKEIAFEFQNAVIDVLISKTKKAIEENKVKMLVVGGGVISNKAIREALKKNLKNTKILIPEKKLATDNSIMIGVAGYLKYLKNPKKYTYKTKIKADGGLKLK